MVDTRAVRTLVRSRLEEYINLGKAGHEINLLDLSGDITDLIYDLAMNGYTIWDDSGTVPIERVLLGVNERGMIIIRINEDAM